MIPFIVGVTLGTSLTIIYTIKKTNKILNIMDNLQQTSIILEKKGKLYSEQYHNTESEFAQGKAYGIYEAVELLLTALEDE